MRKNKTILKDYKVAMELNEQGKLRSKVVYEGDFFVFDNTERELANIKWLMLSALFVSIIIFFSTLLIDSRSSYMVYVVLPQFLALIPLGITLNYSFILFKQKLNLSQKIKINDKAKNVIAVAIALCAVTIIARIVHIAIDYARINIFSEMLIALSCALVLLLSIFVSYLIKSININLENPKKIKEA